MAPAATVSGAEAPAPAPPSSGEVSGTTTPPSTEPGDYLPLASDTDDTSGDTVLWAVAGLLVVGALALMAMFRPGGWRFWRR